MASSSSSRGANAPRRPLADPNRFLIPNEFLPPGFAARVDHPPEPPAPARPAATVVVLRESDRGPEALLLRRPTRSAFAADAWVFPGGRVDDEDADAVLGDHMRGPDARAWARRLELEDETEAAAFVAAAIREVWEETGLVLAEGCEADGASLETERLALLAGERTLAEVAARHSLRFATDALLYVGHWITPVAEPRRYDTRFFAARVPAGAECRLHGEELAEAAWLTPERAVRGFETGELKLLPPTAHTLRRVAGFASLDALWAALRDAPVPSYLPRMRSVDEGVVIEF